jgi:deazaflavin-dependent oxidoreductase (nitroreductase family)
VVSSSDRVRAADEHALHCTALEGPAAVRISTGHASTDTPVRPKAVNSSRPANRETYDQPTMSSNTINGIPRVDLHARPLWKRNVAWWMGGQLGSTKSALALWRKFAAPIEAPIIKATRGRIRLNIALPIVVLTSIGARSGERRETPLAYFTTGNDVILVASNYGGIRHPSWYHNLLAHPECELHIGPRGGRFVAHEVVGAERDELYSLAVDRLHRVFALHEVRSDARAIPVMRLEPSQL